MDVVEAARVLSEHSFHFKSKKEAQEFRTAYNMAIRSLDVLYNMYDQFRCYIELSGQMAASIVDEYIDYVEDEKHE